MFGVYNARHRVHDKVAIRRSERADHDVDRAEYVLGSSMAGMARRAVVQSTTIRGIRRGIRYNGGMGSDAVSGHMEELKTQIIHTCTMVSGIFDDNQSFGDVYEMAEALSHMLREQLDVESAVEILQKLYCIIWPEPKCTSSPPRGLLCGLPWSN